MQQPIQTLPYRMVPFAEYNLLLESFKRMVEEQGASGRVYQSLAEHPRPPALELKTKRAKRSNGKEKVIMERRILKAQILVLYTVDLKDGRGSDTYWMSVQVDEKAGDMVDPHLISKVFRNGGSLTNTEIDDLREFASHDFTGEIKALRIANECNATPELRDVFYVPTLHPQVVLGVFIQRKADAMPRDISKTIQVMRERTFWRAMVRSMQNLAENGLAHLDMNPGNLVVTRGLPIPVQVIDLAEAYRPGNHLPFRDDVSEEDKTKTKRQWRLTIMAQHLVKTWTQEGMRDNEGFNTWILPRMNELMMEQQELCKVLMESTLLPGTNISKLYNTALYYFHRD